MRGEPDWEHRKVRALEQAGLAHHTAQRDVATQKIRRDDALRHALDIGLTWTAVMEATGLSRRGVKLARDRAATRQPLPLALAAEVRKLVVVERAARKARRELDRDIRRGFKAGLTWTQVTALSGLSKRGVQLALARRR